MADNKDFELKAVEQNRAADYTNFGWTRSKQDVPEGLVFKTKEPTVLLKRREEYGTNADLVEKEAHYEKLYKQNNKNKSAKSACAVVFGILVSLLMTVCLILAIGGLAIGISGALNEKAVANGEEGGDVVMTFINEKSPDIAEIIEKFDNLLAGKGFVLNSEVVESEEEVFDLTAKIAEVADGMNEPIRYFVNAYVALGLVGLVLGCVFLIVFISICKMGKRQNERTVQITETIATAKEEVEHMREENESLMTKAERKRHMWETILTNALIRAREENEDKTEDDDDEDDIDFDDEF